MDVTDDDEELMGELGALVATMDPVPRSVTDAARQAFTWRTIDEELALLTFDSAMDELVGMRGAGDRQLSFECGDVDIELDVSAGTGDLVGQVVPLPSDAALEIQFPGDGVTLVPVDGHGMFTTTSRGGGPFRLVLRRAGARPVVTEWVTL